VGKIEGGHVKFISCYGGGGGGYLLFWSHVGGVEK
jgi:hypothetical protein